MADQFSLDDLTTPLSRAEVQQSVYDVLGILGVNTTSWKPGSVVRTMIVGVSAVMAALSELQAQIARGGFLQLSTGPWLSLVAWYVYGVERIDAGFAVGDVVLTNAGGGVYSFDPEDLIVANKATGKTYRNTAPVILPAMSVATVAVQATEAGAESTSGPEEIDTMITTVLGVTCKNIAQLTGTDAESDSALRTRCSERLGALSPFGPWDAYTYAVRNAKRPDGSSLGVTRLRITKDGYGKVTTYLAGVDGAIPGSVTDPMSDLGMAFDAIQRNAAPLAVNAVVESAVERPIAVTYTVWIYNTHGLTDAELKDRIADAIVAFFRAQPIGGNVVGAQGWIYVNAIERAIFDALPEIFQVVVSAPAANVQLTFAEVAIEAAITPAAIHPEPPPEGYGGAV